MPNQSMGAIRRPAGPFDAGRQLFLWPNLPRIPGPDPEPENHRAGLVRLFTAVSPSKPPGFHSPVDE